MSKTTSQQWTDEEEEIISFFEGLIPILMEAKADLESKVKHLPDFSLPKQKND